MGGGEAGRGTSLLTSDVRPLVAVRGQRAVHHAVVGAVDPFVVPRLEQEDEGNTKTDRATTNHMRGRGQPACTRRDGKPSVNLRTHPCARSYTVWRTYTTVE